MAVAVVLLLISSGSVTFLLRFLAALWCDRRVSQSCRAVVLRMSVNARSNFTLSTLVPRILPQTGRRPNSGPLSPALVVSPLTRFGRSFEQVPAYPIEPGA
jgi:hypothetical protein